MLLPSHSLFSLLPLLFLALPSPSLAEVTVYFAPGQQQPLATGSAAAPAQTQADGRPIIGGYAVLNRTELNRPALPNPLPPLQFGVQVQASGNGLQGLSINQQAGFMGFSVEMSVANQILGKNSSLIQVPFLNLMSALIERSGRVNIRVGGNTQEQATLVDTLPNGRIIAKGDRSQASNPTATPPILYTLDLLILMREISDILNVRWYMGAPFNDTSNLKLQIMEHGQAILGDYLLGMQVGNEPDLFSVGGRARSVNYTVNDYIGEVRQFIAGVNADSAITNKSMLIGPSVSGNGAFTEQNVFDAGYTQPDIMSTISHLAVEHYQDNNCALFFPAIGALANPQDQLPKYLKHSAGKSVIAPFSNTPNNIAVPNGKPYIMMETNTVSCGGFPGVSDAFAAALWGVDYSMQLAYANFSGGMFHVGGLTAFYNPFTPPATNESSFHGWSIGPMYYATLVMAEAMGPTNASQIIDLQPNNNNDFTPAYAIYENGVPMRVALFNYMDDPTGASTLSVTVSVAGGNLPQVKVKYLLAPSVVSKYNFTWAGQTFGGVYESDGRLKGDPDVKTVTCNGGNCIITVPAPSMALVFLSDQALQESDTGTTVTFPTTVFTKTLNTATVDASILATSNGHQGFTEGEGNGGSTSRSSGTNEATRRVVAVSMSLAWIVVFVSVIARMFSN